MVTEVKTATKYNCLCGFGTDDVKEFRTHLFKMGAKEKGVHKSLNPGKRPVISLPFKQKETPIIEVPKTPLQKLQDELQAMNQRQANIATAIEKEIAEEAQRKADELKRQEEAEQRRLAAEATTEIVPDEERLTWKAKKPIITKKSLLGGKLASTKTACIIIDHDNHWHINEMVDLKGQDMSPCKWGYYGKRYPVLVEKAGELTPYNPDDTEIAESPHRLYIAAKSSAYKSYMHIENDLLKKIQIGLMALLVVGVLFLIYILVTAKPSTPAEDTISAINMINALLGV